MGGLISHLVSKSTPDKLLGALRHGQGETIASGLIAGGALGGLASAVVRIAGFDWFLKDWVATPGATWLGIVAYLLLSVLLYKKAVSVSQS